MNCPLCIRVTETKNKNYHFLIHEFENSYLYLGEHQFYRGYCVLVTKDHFREMTDIPEPMRQKFFQEMMQVHDAIQKVFNPKKMNMCSLGNVVDHMHWHFFPRYADDPDFKNPPWLQMGQFDTARTAPTERDKLIEMMRAELT